MKLTTYFLAMEKAKHLWLIFATNDDGTNKKLRLGRQYVRFHDGLIRRMERVERQRKVLLNYAEKTLEEAEAKE